MTDVFTAARPEFRRAQTLAAKPIPLAAWEVAEFRRCTPASFAVSALRCIPAFVCAAVFCAAVVALCVMVAS